MIMARFARRGENEPLMRLERPSSASAQTTAHVINACFNEALRQTPLDTKAIHNLSVSRRGERNYHDNFVTELKMVSDEYERRLDVLASLERHLVQARAQALAAEERTLSSMKEDCPRYGDIGLPKGSSKLCRHLDEELLSKHHLLTPSHCLPPSSEPTNPSYVVAPSYLHPTFTSAQHATVPSGLELTAAGGAKYTRPVWQDTMSPLEREAEKNGLAKLEGRADYLRNPRFSNTVLTNTASSGPFRKQQQQQQQQQQQSPDRALQFFVAEPSEIVFTDYQAGESYMATVQLKNVSGVSRQLRIVPIKSPYFSISPRSFPTVEGLIAPGMHCTYTVRFSPDSLANYQDELRVLSHCGECLSVPLKGLRPAPELTLPSILNCGYCLAGSTKTVTVECCNTGGEGNFQLTCGGGSDEPQQTQCSPVLEVGHFSISPCKLHLPHGGWAEFTVVFTPPSVGDYSGQFQMACDNGQVLAFTLKGVAEKVLVGCVFTGPSSSSEIASFKFYPTHFLMDEVDPVISGINSDYCDLREDVLESPAVEFDHVNPHKAAYRTVVMRNFSNVELSYHWRFYRPIIEPPNITGLPGTPLRHEDDPVIGRLIESCHTPFSVGASSGTLHAGEVKKFVFQFLTEKVGSFADMAHLVLSGIPPEGLDLSSEGSSWLRLNGREVSVACVELLAVAERHRIELHPPALLLPGELPIATETRRRVKMLNHSLCEVHYYWSGSDNAGGISVEPSSGSIVSGGCTYCEVVISAKKNGPFSTQLQCNIENADAPLLLPLQGCIQGPVLGVNSASLNFGLVPRGSSSTLQLPLRNESNCSVLFELRQVVASGEEWEEGKEKEEEEEVDDFGFVDYACLRFSPSSAELQPWGSTVVCVECRPEKTGRLRSLVEWQLNGRPVRHIEVLAEIQSPQVSLERCQLHMERVFVGVEENREVRLTNNGLIPAQFVWSSQLKGSGTAHCKVDVRPMTGRIGPRETVTINLGAMWSEVGFHTEVVLQCGVLGMQSPLFLHLSAEVHGLSVSYHIPTSTEEDVISTLSDPEELLLDFGTANPLGSPCLLSVIVTNTSAIPTSLTAHVRHFPAAKPPTPPANPKPVIGVKAVSRGRYLLGRTDNIGDPRSRTCEQAAADYSSAVLRDGRGACFLVDPPSTPLLPFHSHTLTITTHSDMWGEYEDELVCEVPGLEPRVIPIRYGAVGCPIVFQTTASSPQALVRFGSHVPNALPVKRSLKLRNTSSSVIRIDWQTFNIIGQDEKLLDLFSYVGNPFPKQTTSTLSLVTNYTSLDLPSPSSIAAPVPPNASTTAPPHLNAPTDPSQMDTLGSDEECEDEDDRGGHLFRVTLKAHEGVPSNTPFDIHPKQMVIPAHGQGAVCVTFLPSSALKHSGETLASYALGYFSLDQQDPPHVSRSSGYDVEPLRINTVAGIEHARLSLESDEDEGLHFSYPASTLLQETEVQESVTKTHHFTLFNRNASTLEFQLTTFSSHFTLTTPPPETYIGLKPQKSLSVSVTLTLSLDDVRSVEGTEKDIKFADELQIDFSTGARQVFPLTASIALPSLTLSEKKLEFGTCVLGKSRTCTVALSNTTTSSVLWESYIPPDLSEVVSLSPRGGVLLPHLSQGKCSTELLHVTFTPRVECTYDVTVRLDEVLTGTQLNITIKGSGSADEQFSH